MSENRPLDARARRLSFLLFALVVSVYLLTFSGYSTSDVSYMRLAVAESIVERHSIEMAPGTGLKAANGRDYSYFSIGTVLIAVPLQVLKNVTGIHPEKVFCLVNLCASAASGVLVFLFSFHLGYSYKTALKVALLYAFGTMAWFHSKDSMDHSLETFWLLLSVYSMFRYTQRANIFLIALSIMAMGLAFLTRPNTALALPILLVLLLMNRGRSVALREVVTLGVGLVPFFALFLWYNHARFGSILETGYLILYKVQGADFFSGTPLWKGLAGLLLSPGKSYFLFTPAVLLLTFSASRFCRKQTPLAIGWSLTTASYLVLYGRTVGWHGDYCWGPRYLMAVTPFLIIPLSELFEDDSWWKHRGKRFAACSIIALSVAVQALSVSIHFNRFFAYNVIERHASSIISGLPGGVPYEFYFSFKDSQLVKQVHFVGEAFRDIGTYEYRPAPQGATPLEKIKSAPQMHVFDFWWVYKFYVERSFVGFQIAFVILVFGTLIALRLKHVLGESASFAQGTALWRAANR